MGANAGQRITIPARRGKAAYVRAGQRVKVINTHGAQVVDTWAFERFDQREAMSMEHTRATLVKIRPEVGDHLYTNRRRPILTLLEDTSGGVHDTLMAACDSYRYGLLGCTEYHDNCTDNLSAAMHDSYRYGLLGCTEYHDNCTDNLSAAMHELGMTCVQTPSPLNLFMNIPWTGAGALAFEAPNMQPGDFVVFQAQLDAVVAFSACPQDILPINGEACSPTEAHFEILD